MSIRLQRRLALPTITLTACVELENTSFTREIIHQKSKLKKDGGVDGACRLRS